MNKYQFASIYFILLVIAFLQPDPSSESLGRTVAFLLIFSGVAFLISLWGDGEKEIENESK